MSDFFKAELKDKFLQYALEQEDYVEVQLLYDEFLRPNYSLQYVDKLIGEIIEYDPNLLDCISGNGAKIFMLSATSDALDFLQEGGFKDLYIQEEEKWDTFFNQLSSNSNNSPKEKVKTLERRKSVFRKERLLLFGLLTAVGISFIFTLVSIIAPLFEESKAARIQQIEKKIERLETENTRLKGTLDSLQFYPKKTKG